MRAAIRNGNCRQIATKSISIQLYVFPGGMLPSPQVLKSPGKRFGVPVIRERIFGQDYAKTLAIWRSNFRAAWPNLIVCES
jgi:cyclopropane-fatty-acyl-phospholipid synthase